MGRNRIFFFSLAVVLFITGQAGAQLKSHLLVENEAFFSPQYEATEQSQYQFVGFKIQNRLDAERLILDSEAVMAVSVPLLNYIKIKEAALLIPNGESQNLIVGRKKLTWSEMDDSWSLGSVESVFKWNPLDRESQGLVGLYWQSQLSNVQMTAFLSPVFLPDQGPHYEIDKEGQFKKSNPWFQTPPTTLRLFPGSNTKSKIRYNVKMPPESDILLQTSVGAGLEGTIGNSFLWRGSYFNKPMNQMMLGFDGVYNTGTDTGYADILPQVAHHQVATVDLIWSIEQFRFGVSALSDRPTRVDYDEDWTAPILEDAMAYSPFVQFNFGKQSLRFGYLIIEGGEVKETGEFADSERAPITSRFPFTEAARAQYQFVRSEKMKFELSWTHSDRNQFDLVQARGQYRFQRRWEVFADLQTVKARPVTGKNANEIGPHANNDRIMIGAAYEL